jgi:NAD(P)-dependent dehydrogenase (short-subunit alcohol dehydrogenase family)
MEMALIHDSIPDSEICKVRQPQDIALAAVFFASSDSTWITGETLIISGSL